MPAKVVSFAGSNVGPGNPCFIIAEAGVNHNGDMSVGHRLIGVAADAGADAVKFQTFRTANLVTRNAPKAAYQKQTTRSDESQFALLERLELTREMHLELIAHCEERKILFLSTPFDEESADMLAGLGLPCLKMPSGELTNYPFLEHVSRLDLPVILSTGMGSLAEVDQAVRTFRTAGNDELILLHCVSNYPAVPRDCNLRAMRTMEVAFGLPVGFSDHTPGSDISLAAVAMGACILEKHFTTDRSLPGPDHKASLEPGELQAMVRAIRDVEAALGNGRKVPMRSESDTSNVARKSIVAEFDIAAGEILTADMLRIKRPGTGLPPAMLSHVVGRRARADIPADTMISLDQLQ